MIMFNLFHIFPSVAFIICNIIEFSMTEKTLSVMLLFKIPLDSKQLHCIRLKVIFIVYPIIWLLSKVCDYYEVSSSAALQNLDYAKCFARSSHQCHKYRYSSCSWSTQLQSLHKESAVTAEPGCIFGKMTCSKFINIDWMIREQEPSLVLSIL
jgi:uncharacterized membrane protein YbaN (DUF454 family)